MLLFSSSNIVQLPPSKSDLWIWTEAVLRRIISTARPLFPDRDHSKNVKKIIYVFSSFLFLKITSIHLYIFSSCTSNTNTDTRKFSVFISYRRTYVEVYSSALFSFELCNWSYVFFLLLFSSLSPRCMNDKASAEENDFSSESCWFRACGPFNVCTVLSCQQSLVCISNWQVLLLIIFHNHPTAVLVNPFGRIVWLDCPYQEYVEVFSCVLKVIIVFFFFALQTGPEC